MHWKTKQGTFLIEMNWGVIPFINCRIGLPGGETFDGAGEYVEAANTGEVLKRYSAPMPFSIEDEMTVSNIHLVIGDGLYKFYYSHRFWYDPEFTFNLLLDGLTVYKDALPFDEQSLIR